MAKMTRLAGSTSQILMLFIQDSSSPAGAGLTGLAFGSAGLTCYYKRDTGAASVAVTLATITTLGTYATGGFKEVDPAQMPGLYEFHPPDAAYASGAKSAAFLLLGATDMVPVPIEIELTAVDNQSANAFITGVNSLAPPANWNLMGIDGAGRVDAGKFLGHAVVLDANFYPSVNLVDVAGVAASTVSGVDANVVTIAGQAVTCVAPVTIPATIGTSTLTALQVRQEMDANSTKLDVAVSSRAAAASALSTAVWTGTKAGFIDAAISGVSAAVLTDTTDTASAGSLGALIATVNTNLDAKVSTRLATGGYTAPANVSDYARNNVAPSWFSAGSGVPLDGGTVSASPTPTATLFTATGANLHAPTGGYTTAPMALLFTSGVNAGQKIPIATHTVSGSNHVFSFAVGFTNAPASTDTFLIG